jgi:serine protease inhibitor
MMFRILSVTFAAAVALLGVASAAPAPASLAPAYDGFGLRLFDSLAASGKEANVFVSPTSIAIALAMTANAAQGSTRAAILKTLGVSDTSIGSFNAANAALMKELQNPGNGMVLSIANALWLNQRLSLEPQFVKTGHDVYDATAKPVAFGNPSAAEAINAWVKAHTNGLIPQIVDSTDASDAAILTNAVALKAKWDVPFEKADTRSMPFTTNTGASMNVSMMQRNGSFAYADSAKWQIVRLPYKGDRFAMYVLLPHPGTSLASLLSQLDANAFDAAIGAAKPQYMHLGLPRFVASYSTQLNAPLKAMGMGNAFEPGSADFGGLVPPPERASISSVNHRAFVRVDEEGTEAAAATSVGIRLAAMPMAPAVKMVVDRPFFMAIRDDTTKQLLFIGAIGHPEPVSQ